MFAKTREFIKRTNYFDPVAEISRRLFGGIPLLTAVVVGIVMVTGWWLMGKYSENIDPVPTPVEICARFHVEAKDCPDDITIVYHTDYAEYSFAVFLWGIFVPVIWWYYLSVHKIWDKLLQSLIQENLVDSSELNNTIKPFLEGSFWLASLLSSIFVMALYVINSIPSEIKLGRASFWTLTPQGTLMVTLYVGINTFVLVSFALRTLILIVVTARFFNTKGVKDIHVFHVDRCGGFGAVGTLATQLSSLAVVVGFWAVWYSVLPAISGEKIDLDRMNFDFTVKLLYSAYLILVPVLLIVLTRPVGMAMKRYKQQLLMQVSKLMQDELDMLVNEAKLGNVEVLSDLMKVKENRQKSLQQLYEKLSLIPESPIRLVNMKRFTGFAVLPALVSFSLQALSLYSTLSDLTTK